MQKDKALKSMAVISAVLSGISVLLGCIAVIFPQSCGLFFGDLRLESWSLGSAMPFMLIEALFPLLLMTLAVFSAVSGTMTYKKGIVSTVLTVSYQIVKTLAGFEIWKISVKLCHTNRIALLGSVNSALTVINYLNFFAVLLLISMASIEIYASKKGEKYENFGL